MFIQVIQGKVSDEGALRRNMDRWTEELMPGAVGFLGTTAGIADDGRFIALARFEDADAARANSDRPEQGAWWAEMEKCFDGEVSFMDCDNVRTWLDGGSDDAGFVQIMQGRADNVGSMFDMMMRDADRIREARPELIGGLLLEGRDGRWLNAIYFDSEEAARQGEQQEMPEDMRAEREEGMRRMGEVSYLDLRDPILVSKS